MAATIRLIDSTDASVFDNVADGVFDNEIQADQLHAFLNDSRHHMAVALEGSQIVGFASAVHYVHPDKAPQLWINEVAVAPAYHRQGLGRALMEALLRKGRELQCTEAWVLTEHDNEPARALYRAAGGQESRCIMVTFPFENTPGEDAAC